MTWCGKLYSSGSKANQPEDIEGLFNTRRPPAGDGGHRANTVSAHRELDPGIPVLASVGDRPAAGGAGGAAGRDEVYQGVGVEKDYPREGLDHGAEYFVGVRKRGHRRARQCKHVPKQARNR